MERGTTGGWLLGAIVHTFCFHGVKAGVVLSDPGRLIVLHELVLASGEVGFKRSTRLSDLPAKVNETMSPGSHAYAHMPGTVSKKAEFPVEPGLYSFFHIAR